MSMSETPGPSKRSRRLPPAHEELLKKAFPNQPWTIEKILVGYSGASVYQVNVNDDPVIIKIAHPAIIQRESDNYAHYVENKLRSNIPRLSPPVESDDQQWALLKYTYAGVRQSQTLLEYVRNKGSNEIGRILDDIFYDYGEPWWGDHQRKRIRCSIYYDRLLPEHLQLTALDTLATHALPLNAREIDQDILADIEVGNVIHLQEFKIEKEKQGVLTLYADSVHDGRIRFKLSGLPGQAEEVLAPTYAVVTKTRKSLLDDYVQNTINPRVDSFTLRAPHFTIARQPYHNPFPMLAELLDTPYQARISLIHGDLNLQNILIEEDLRTKAYRRSWLIDFAATGIGPVLLDLQWLETQTLTWLLPLDLEHNPQSAASIAVMLEALHNQASLPGQLPPALHRSYTVLREIRRVAEGYLVDKNDWREYYRGLTVALLGVLKYEELSSFAHQLALIGAATTVKWTGVLLTELPSVGPPPVKQPTVMSAIQPVSSPPEPVHRSMQPATPRLPRETNQGQNTTTRPGKHSPFTLEPTRRPRTLPRWLGAVVAAGIGLILLAIGFGFGRLSPASDPTSPSAPISILTKVRQNGYVTCGINGALPYFSEKKSAATPEGLYDQAVGFDADFCRAVAIAVFGTYTNTVKFKSLTTEERFNQVADRQVDVLFRNSSWTTGRDAKLRIDFGPVYLYTSQQVMVNDRENIKLLDDLTGKPVCMAVGTTAQANLAYFDNKGIQPTPIFSRQGITFTNTDAAALAFFGGDTCQAITSDTAQLLAYSHSGSRKSENYPILPDILADEFYAPAVPENDSQWRDIVSYAVWATIYAEQLGINQANVSARAQSADLYDKLFLGIQAKGIVQPFMGDKLGIAPDFAGKIVEQVGNYADIYQRNLNSIAELKDRGRNQVWKIYANGYWTFNQTGRLFSPPFTP